MRIVYNFINNQLSGDQARILTGTNKFIRIRYNLNERIIATPVKEKPETQLRILDKSITRRENNFWT